MNLHWFQKYIFLCCVNIILWHVTTSQICVQLMKRKLLGLGLRIINDFNINIYICYKLHVVQKQSC
jgi:hypothetical protein